MRKIGRFAVWAFALTALMTSCSNGEEINDEQPVIDNTVAKEVELVMSDFTRALEAETSGLTGYEMSSYFMAHVLPKYGIVQFLDVYIRHIKNHCFDEVDSVYTINVGEIQERFTTSTLGWGWNTESSDSLVIAFSGPDGEKCEYSFATEGVGESEPLELQDGKVLVVMPTAMRFMSKVNDEIACVTYVDSLTFNEDELICTYKTIKDGTVLMSGNICTQITMVGDLLILPSTGQMQMNIGDRVAVKAQFPNVMQYLMYYLSLQASGNEDAVRQMIDKFNENNTCEFFVDGITQGTISLEPIYENGRLIADVVVKYTSDGTSYAYFHGLITKIYTLLERYMAYTNVSEWFEGVWKTYFGE